MTWMTVMHKNTDQRSTDSSDEHQKWDPDNRVLLDQDPLFAPSPAFMPNQSLRCQPTGNSPETNWQGKSSSVSAPFGPIAIVEAGD